MITRDELIKLDRDQQTEGEKEFFKQIEELVKKAYLRGSDNVSIVIPTGKKLVPSRIVEHIRKLGYRAHYTYSLFFGDCVSIFWGGYSFYELDESGY